MKRLFGTDGIRGRAYEAPLDTDTLQRLGCALATELSKKEASPRLLLAGDTRASTTDLASWLAESFQAAGGKVTWAGVLPTPAVSHLLRDGEWSAGVVISASHNPAQDNGVKVLGRSGEKIADETEQYIEHMLQTVQPVAGPSLPSPDTSLAERYLDLIVSSHNGDGLQGQTIVVDAANGAASGLAKTLFERLGAKVSPIHSCPDGTNINRDCGATVPEVVAAEVTHLNANAGVALDGDADRVMLADDLGQTLDGDDVLLVWARSLSEKHRLPGNKIVATVMSNFGLERALAESRIEIERCPVGDRSVWLAMKSSKLALGGEQSGHIICAHHSVTGDGLLTGSQVLAVAVQRDVALSQLSDLRRMPQILLNVDVNTKPPLRDVEPIQRALSSAEVELEGRGRVLLRYSGTERLARVMVEGDDDNQITQLAEHLAGVITRELG